ncbi:hypothetical protein, partial [Dysosmobacter sp.]|uniref:hypothetical protein n=1 Tax=Dysosmobacter sp. TaxID=2591382 RepID=UPI002A8BD991
DRARPVFFGQDPKKMGETGEAPPAAETASLFRGSGTIGGPNGAGNRIAATVVCKAVTFVTFPRRNRRNFPRRKRRITAE